jgi:serine/threonine protein kinase
MISTEYIPAGDLLNLIKKRSKLSESISKFLFKQLLDALKYMHTQGIIHRDVKLDNILIDINNTIKICDFGLSKIAEEDALYNTICGSPIYMPYEMLSNQEYNYKVDIWALGIVLYELLYLSHPFFECKSLSDIVYTKSSNKIIIKKEKPYSDQYYPDHIIDFLKKFLDNQDNRLSWKEIISYQWVEYTKTQVFKSLTYDRIKNNMPFDVISNYHDNKFHKSGEYEVINDELIFEIDILK